MRYGLKLNNLIIKRLLNILRSLYVTIFIIIRNIAYIVDLKHIDNVLLKILFIFINLFSFLTIIELTFVGE